MMKEDDAAELIAKSADTTLGVIGGDLTDKRCLCLCSLLFVFVFIGPESDHCLPLSLTHSLTHSLLFSKLD